MDSKRSSFSAALFFSLNLLPFVLASAQTWPTQSPLLNPNSPSRRCPKDTLQLGVCVELLDGTVTVIGNAINTPCCSLLEGLVDIDVAICLCMAIKADILGADLNIPVSLNLLINACGKCLPPNFECS